MEGLFPIFGESLAANVVLFAAGALAVGLFGSRLTGIADQLADRAGFGEALVGGVLMGAVTSLSGSVLSVSAALNDQPVLALSNAFGGMAAQTVFLAVADIFHRRANLEHAAASAENMVQGTMLVCLLSLPLLAAFSPEWHIWKIHPVTPLMIGGYIYGMNLVRRYKSHPMWKPTHTKETEEDKPQSENEGLSLSRLWISFTVFGLILGVTGWVLQKTATNIVEMTGMHQAVMGVLFTSTATSLPELVTSIAAVRRGALTLAVSGIIGGNAYDSLFAAFSDMAYRQGSIYHALTPTLSFWIAVNIFMTGVLIMGLLLREKRGVGGIGFESSLVIVTYVVAVAVLIATGGAIGG